MEPSAQRARPPLIVLADDSADTREMYRQFFAFVGFDVETAATGREVLDKVRCLAPDIFILDLSMPDLDGWAVCRTLKADPQTKTIPIIVLTGHTLDGAEASAKAAGANYYLMKPCLPEELADAVRSVLSARSAGTD
jgi:CheY-like chemotaxis protein